MKRKAPTKIVYIILLCITFLTHTVNTFPISQKSGFIILLVLIIWSFINLIANSFRIKNTNKRIVLEVYLKNNLTIKIVMHIYTLFLVFFGLTEARFLSTNLITYINAISAIAIVYFLEENAWEISLISLFMTWFIAFLWQIIVYGITFFEHIEFNDLAFATGYLIIYYIIVKKNWTKKDFFYLIIALSIIILTGKRIGIVSLILIFLIHVLYNAVKNNRKIKNIYISIISVALIVILYLFIYVIIEGSLFELLSKYTNNIEQFLMGRNYYWKVLANICEFKWSFIGYGRNASATLFTNEYAHMHVGNVHSDILKNYMECGFILFGVWLYIYIIRFRKDIQNKISFHNAYIFFLMTVYTFLVYISDNTETYPITQYMYMLIPIICALKEKNIDKVNL